MTTLPNLTPDSTGTVSGVVDQAGGTTSLHLRVTDASDTTYLTGGVDAGGTVLLGLSDVPGDFANMDTLGYEIRLRLNGTQTDDTMTFSATVYDGNATTTPLTNTVQVATHADAGGTFNLKTGALTIQGTPTLAQWNNAFLHLEWTYVKNMASDSIAIHVAEAAVTGTYTTTNAPPNTPTITAPADGATISGTVSLEATVSDPDGDDVYAVWELWAGDPGTIINTLGPFGHNNSWGLTHDGTNIWNSDPNSDSIYEIDPSNGNVLRSIPSPGATSSGVTWDGTNLWNADLGTDLIYKLDPTDGTVLDSFAAPGGSPTGLAWDGTNLWSADQGTGLIYKLDPTDGTVLDSIPGQGNVWGIEWNSVNSTLFQGNSSASPDQIYTLDPADGTVLDSFDSPSTSTFGICYNGGSSMWIMSSGEWRVYEVEIAALIEDIVENTTPVASGSTHTTSWDAGAITGGDYELRAWSIDSLGLSSGYDSVPVTVTGIAPTTAPNLVMGSTTTSSIAMSCGTADGAITYEFQQSDAGAGVWTTFQHTESRSATATGLNGNTSYDFRVRGVNGNGGGPWSTTVTGTTDNTSPDEPVIVNPAAGATISGLVSLEATVTDPDGDDVRAVWELWESGVGGDYTALNTYQKEAITRFEGGGYDGVGSLWVCEQAADEFIEYDVTNGAELSRVAMPFAGINDITWDGTNWWAVRSGRVLKLSSDLTAVVTEYTSSVFGNAFVTFDGTNLWMTNGNNDLIREHTRDDPVGPAVSTFTGLVADLGIAWDGENLRIVENYSSGAGAKIRTYTRSGTLLDEGGYPFNDQAGAWGLGWVEGVLWLIHGGSGEDFIAELTQSVVESLVEDITENATAVTSGSNHTTTWNASSYAGVYELRAWAIDTEAAQSATYDSHSVTIEESTGVILVANDSTHGHVSEEVSLTLAADVVVQEATHTHQSENVTITYRANAPPEDSHHAHASEQATLTENPSLTVEDSHHAHSAEKATAVPTDSLNANDSNHAHVSDSPTLTEYTSVVIADSLHGHTSEPVTASATYAVVVGSVTHGHSSEQSMVVEHPSLAVMDAGHLHASDQVTVSASYQVAPQDSAHGQSSEQATVTEHPSLVSGGSSHAHSSETVDLTEHAALTVEDSLHPHTSDKASAVPQGTVDVNDTNHAHASGEVSLTEYTSVIVEDSTHGHASESVTASVVYSITPGDTGHAHTSEQATATENPSLAVQGSNHGHDSEQVVVSTSHVLDAQDSTHGHVASQGTVSTTHVIAPEDSHHAHASEQATLTENPSLTVEDSHHAHTSEKGSAVPQGTLDINDSSHGHTSEQASLAEQASVAALDSQHGHASEQVALSVTYDLVPGDAVHGHTSEGVSLTEHPDLVVGDSLHGHASEEVTLTENTTGFSLVVEDATHGHSSEQVVLTSTSVIVPDVVPVFEAQAPVVDAGTGTPMPVTTARVYVDGEFKQRSVKIYRDGKFV